MTLASSSACFAAALLAIGAILACAGASSARAGDKDCVGFATQRAAQVFFLEHGGPRYDPDRLDADHDGVACEDNSCPCYYKKHLPRRPQIAAIEDRRATRAPA